MKHPHDLDARALKKRLEDRDVIIGVLRDRCKKLEGAIDYFLTTHVVVNQDDVDAVRALAKALEVLPPVKP